MINNGLNLALERAHQDGREWKFGALSDPGIVTIPPQERSIYLPLGLLQNSGDEKFDCATRSPINHLEALFSYHYMHDMREENKAWLKEKGYIEGSRVVFSDRYISILAGTTREGNSLKKPIDTIHSQGLVPNALLPQTEDMSFDEYYAGMTPQLKVSLKPQSKRLSHSKSTKSLRTQASSSTSRVGLYNSSRYDSQRIIHCVW
jgi:hypothetical protein